MMHLLGFLLTKAKIWKKRNSHKWHCRELYIIVVLREADWPALF